MKKEKLGFSNPPNFLIVVSLIREIRENPWPVLNFLMADG